MDEDLQLTTLRQDANRKILVLNGELGTFANEMYTVPPEPSVGHMTRMLGDLDALYTRATSSHLPTSESLSTKHEAVRERLERIRAYLNNPVDAKQS